MVTPITAPKVWFTDETDVVWLVAATSSGTMAGVVNDG